MAEKLVSSIDVDIVLPNGQALHSGAPLPALVTEPFAVPSMPAFDADSTTHFQSKMTKAPEWFCSMVASNSREKRRFASELVHIKGAWPLLMKQRNGGKWTADEKTRLKTMVRSASNVSPYLFIWAIPGSMLLLPFWPGFWTSGAKTNPGARLKQGPGLERVPNAGFVALDLIEQHH